MSNSFSGAIDRDWEILAAARHGLLDLNEFEHWVYSTSRLEPLLGRDGYLSLISFDFRQPSPQHELTSLLDAIFATMRPEWRKDVAVWVAEAFLGQRIHLTVAARVLARFWSDRCAWVPSEFAYIDSELDGVPMPEQYHLWQPAALRRKLEEAHPLMPEFQRAAREAATELLSTLRHP